MSYNPYGPPPGGHRYGGGPPGYTGYGAPPGIGPPQGIGAPPGISRPPPGISPPGLHQPPPTHQANRPGALPSHFQAPGKMPDFDLNAPVIRLSTATPTTGGRSDAPPREGGRPGLGMDRGTEHHGRSQPKELQPPVPPTPEEKLRTIFLHQIPEGAGGDEGIERLLGAVGRLSLWDSLPSLLEENKGMKFGFATFDDPESLSVAVKIFVEQGVEVPVHRQPVTQERPTDDEFEGIEKIKLKATADASSVAYVISYTESKADEVEKALEAATLAVKEVLRELFYPSKGPALDTEGDVNMANAENGNNVEVVSIPLAQDDELSDIPPEMREMVAGEIASFRARSAQQDLERLRQEEEMEAREKQRSAAARSRLESPPTTMGANSIPVGPRGHGVPNAPSGPRERTGDRTETFMGVPFTIYSTDYYTKSEEEDSDIDDDELWQRVLNRRKDAEEKKFVEMERKWINRERSRALALEREKEREMAEAESHEKRKQEAMARDEAWVDDPSNPHLYYRDHAAWVRKRAIERADEEGRDAIDRRMEADEKQREQQQMEQARGMADSFLDRQANEMAQHESVAAAPQPFKLSLGAAAQKNQASRSATQRHTIADVEGLLDDEEADAGTKRQLIPIQFDSTTAASSMTDEEISQAVRSLAQEIPSEKAGLWQWEVKWEFMDDAVVSEKLRPFVEKKIVEYLGVQEEMLVATVEEHLRKHGTAAALVDELEGALDDEAEDLVKKLWRMVIFFTECEKRGLPA